MSEDFIDNVNEKNLDQQVVVGVIKHQMVVSWLDKHWTKVQKTNLVKDIQVTLFSKQNQKKTIQIRKCWYWLNLMKGCVIWTRGSSKIVQIMHLYNMLRQ